jgi:hypothetical protein
MNPSRVVVVDIPAYRFNQEFDGGMPGRLAELQFEFVIK